MAHEQALVEAGRGDLVMEVRDAINDAIRSQYVAVIERVLGRRVVGFMAGNQHEPDLGCHVYVLAPAGKPPGETARTHLKRALISAAGRRFARAPAPRVRRR